MKDLLSIVIPSKNEKHTIYECLRYINNQFNIDGIKVIIADISDDNISKEILEKSKSQFTNLDIEIIEGGYPAKGRLEGSKLVKTPFILFLDADVMLKDEYIIFSLLKDITNNEYIHLITVPFQTDKKWNWVFRMFDISQNISKLIGTPFAVGGFQLWRTTEYWIVGGYNPDEIFSEDYSITSKVKSRNFYINKKLKVYTSSRRFENKGFIFMFRLLLLSFLNRNNPEFFKKHHNYWK
jgi:glycosyltransferase involved in cell wall biosynthesis